MPEKDEQNFQSHKQEAEEHLEAKKKRQQSSQRPEKDVAELAEATSKRRQVAPSQLCGGVRCSITA
jgi:hypothetical protein